MEIDAGKFKLLRLDALGLRVDVRLVGAEATGSEPALARAWSRCLATASGWAADIAFDAAIGASADLPKGGLAAADLPRLSHLLSPTVTVGVIDHLAGEIVMLHAAALADRSGATAVFVGASGAGKTTVCRTLGRHLGYITDETVAIETDGSIRMYPKPLSVIEADLPVKAQISPDDLGLAEVQARPYLSRIHLLDRDPGHRGPPTIESVDKLEALAAIATQSSHLKRLPRPLHALAEVIDTVRGVTRVRYADASDLLPMVDELVAAR